MGALLAEISAQAIAESEFLRRNPHVYHSGFSFMTLALQAQLEQLGRTLAARNNQSAALFDLPNKEPISPCATHLRAAESPPEAAEVVFRKEEMAVPLEEAVESFSARQVLRVVAVLKPLAWRVYVALHLLGCTIAHRRGYHRNAGQVSFFCPAEAICAYLGISRGSFYRSLKELVALGLVDARGHKTTLNGRAVRCDGTLWSVKLFPKQGSRAKVRFEDLKASYRDLEADIEAGRTVYQQMRQSKTSEAKQVGFGVLVTWALTPYLEKNPVTLTVASDERLELEILLDVSSLPKRGRREGVDRAARALGQHLSDARSLNFYRYLVWQLLRLDQQGRGYFDVLYTMVQRVKADLEEGFARQPGALLVSRLKACSLWDEIREASDWT